MGLEENQIAAVVLGKHFEWLDMVLCSLGGLIIAFFERAGWNSKLQLKAKANQICLRRLKKMFRKVFTPRTT